ncbi:MAG TPA: FHA domain-containing protein, partial [Stellaceae bacterium]|nr:FHA domain-containing protein [Stellaceae bacterium]
MEEVTWIEVLGRHRDVVARLRFAGAEIRVGRAYDNDLVLDDPYVAPRHLLIRRETGGALVAEDLGSANGLYLDRGKTR